jgi:thymidylate synthase
MQNYHQLLKTVLEHGLDQFNTRTGKVCRAVVGYQLQFDLAAGFPAITTKKLAFNNMKGELLGFFRGYSNAADFRALGCTVWDDNANKTAAWLANPNRKGLDDLGPVYGKQWTDWTSYRETDSADSDAADRLFEEGYRLVCDDGKVSVFRKSINQLENALRKLITDPSDRRIIVSGWNVGEFDLMALPPCHMDYRFVAFDGPSPDAPKVLHVVMTIRSWDLFLGAPFNIASTSLFLAIMARLSGMEPGTVSIQATNAHLYEDHYEQVREQLSREHMQQPTLWLSDNIKQASIDNIPGVFTRIQPDDIKLDGYQSHAAIKAPMAA